MGFRQETQTQPACLEILGDGKQSKQYLYVTDCVNGILSGYHHLSGRVNNINLGVNEQTLVDRVADLVIQEMSLKNVARRYTGGARGWIGDNAIVDLSLDRIKQTGWKHVFSPDEAIRTTIKWTIQEAKTRSRDNTA